MRLLKLFSVFLLLWIVAAGVLSQGTAHKAGTMHTVKTQGKVYACPECDVASMKAGKCPMCGKAMGKINAKQGFGCDDCHVFSAKAGKCPKCGKAMGKAVETYACEKCQTSSTKPGKCPKCGKALKKYDLKVS